MGLSNERELLSVSDAQEILTAAKNGEFVKLKSIRGIEASYSEDYEVVLFQKEDFGTALRWIEMVADDEASLLYASDEGILFSVELQYVEDMIPKEDDEDEEE